MRMDTSCGYGSDKGVCVCAKSEEPVCVYNLFCGIRRFQEDGDAV